MSPAFPLPFCRTSAGPDLTFHFSSTQSTCERQISLSFSPSICVHMPPPPLKSFQQCGSPYILLHLNNQSSPHHFTSPLTSPHIHPHRASSITSPLLLNLTPTSHSSFTSKPHYLQHPNIQTTPSGAAQATMITVSVHSTTPTAGRSPSPGRFAAHWPSRSRPTRRMER